MVILKFLYTDLLWGYATLKFRNKTEIFCNFYKKILLSD